jgi:helicase required for RNAi-mediated heterochromatin assembly 1
VRSIGVCAKASFSLNRAGKQIRWQQSKRLIPGTLVCLSQDNFETFKIATVAARPLGGLSLNPPEVDLIFHVDEIEIDATKPFLMVESRQGYFEAFKWVLRAIQRMNAKNMSLHEHIVMLDKDVGPPKYLETNPIYNLTSIYPDVPDKESVDEVNILQSWPRKTNSMDKSQIDALRTILTKKVAVVQGPPGTGKTYTSVRALHAILQNMSEDDPPIIVACQTNHALDQLLRHVYKFEHEIIRLGGRTTDRGDIKKRTMYQVRKESMVKIQGRSLGGMIKEMDAIRGKMCAAIAPLSADLISPDALFDLKLINQKQMEYFAAGSHDWVKADTDDKPNSPIASWLCDSVTPVDKIEDIYHEVEDAEIDYEALLDLEAEFLGVNQEDDEFKDELSGFYYRIKHNFQVHCPDGVSDSDLRRALRTQNVWDLSEVMRAAVYCHWESEATKKIREKLKVLNREYQRLVREFKIARMEKDAYLMSRAKLVGMTTTGLSKYRGLIASCQPKVILIEEAAECLEAPVLVGCLPSIQHLILVGDHKQLKGKCNDSDLQGEPYYLDVSLFERWVDNKMPYVALRTQRRKYSLLTYEHPTEISRYAS